MSKAVNTTTSHQEEVLTSQANFDRIQGSTGSACLSSCCIQCLQPTNSQFTKAHWTPARDQPASWDKVLSTAT